MFGVDNIEMSLLMALKDICEYNLGDKFDELFRVVKIKDSSDAAIGAAEPPTAQEIVLDVAAMEGTEGKAQGEAGSCHELGLIVQQNLSKKVPRAKR